MLVVIVAAGCGTTPSTLTQPSATPAVATATPGSETATPAVSVTVSPEAVVGPSTVASGPSPAASATTNSTHAPATARPTEPPSTALPPGGRAIAIADFAFAPATVMVRVGARVTWTNHQAGISHTVTADDGAFGSAQLATGSSFSRVFTQVGAYTYHCTIHTDMTGTVIVGG